MSKIRVKGNALLWCYMSREGCVENFCDSWKTQDWSLGSFDSLNCQNQEKLSFSKMSEDHSLDGMAEKWGLSSKNLIKCMCEKVHAIQVLGTITSKFKREATSWHSRMKGNDAEKRRLSGPFFIFLVMLRMHSFEFLLNYF